MAPIASDLEGNVDFETFLTPNFSGSKAVTYTVKLAMSRKWCKIDAVATQTMSRK